ncbi:hypothetical protein Q9233_015132 [Columba guinea]|nr:hypothetical protein Q9233_015132 [Columba guinea]
MKPLSSQVLLLALRASLL